MIVSRSITVETSSEAKNSPPRAAATGMPRRSSARRNTAPTFATVRRRIAMSPQAIGRSPSPSATGVCARSISSIRRATSSASRARRSGVSPSSPSSDAPRSSSSGTGRSPRYLAAPKRSAAASSYSTSPSARDMHAENTAFAASMISRRERKFSRSRMRRSSPSAARASSRYDLYFSLKISGSARRKR